MVMGCMEDIGIGWESVGGRLSSLASEAFCRMKVRDLDASIPFTLVPFDT